LEAKLPASNFEGASIGLGGIRQAVAAGRASRAAASSSVIQGFAAKPGFPRWGLIGDWQLVTPGTILSFIPLLLGLFAAQPVAMQQSVTRLVIQDEVILRVPVEPRALGPQIDWVERKAPRCIPVAAIRAALLSGQSQVDFILAGGTRVRAKFDEDCPALDFYGGFYLQPQDERLCADRDAVHSRIGGSCTIDHFKQLIPKLRR
jgi:hypothetical protein